MTIKDAIYHIKRLFKITKFLLLVFIEIISASLRVALAVISPKHTLSPAFLYLPLDCKVDKQITFLSNVISLTPGTLTVGVSPNKDYLLLHVMFFYQEEVFVKKLKQKFEYPIMELFS